MSEIITETTSAEITSLDTKAVDVVFQEIGIQSLSKRIASVVDIQSPLGGFFNITRKDGTNDFEILKSSVAVYEDIPIQTTDITKEVMDDIRALYGKDAESVVAKLLKGVSNELENNKLMTFLDANASVATALIVTGGNSNAETVIFEAGRYITELVMKMNMTMYKTYGSFAILPVSFASSFLALSSYVANEEANEIGLFIGKNNFIRYYINPNPAATAVYVGLIDEKEPAKSSIVMSPYHNEVVRSRKKGTGEEVFGVINRFALTMNPLHKAGNEMLFKFAIS